MKIVTSLVSPFSEIILRWYDLNKRSLPWRDTSDPYVIWLSEVILQQTRVEQGLPYFKQFVATFPDVHRLAAATEQQVLKLWEGLGYYSRGRNLHRCAREIVREYAGEFPQRAAGLIKLPGVGPYTASAIASIAFNERVPVLDGNVFRILSRIFGITADISSHAGRAVFLKKASPLVPLNRPGDFNQSMMELGALVCTPRNPRCDVCPFSSMCVARRGGSIAGLPVKSKKAKVKTRFFYYFILRKGSRIGMRKRSGGDIWTGLYDFHLVTKPGRSALNRIVGSDPLLKKLRRSSFKEAGSTRHLLTHQILNIRFFDVDVEKENMATLNDHMKPIRFISTLQALRLPKPVPVKMFLERVSKG